MKYDFEEIDISTISGLIRKRRNLLPYKKVGETKFVRWNSKKITAEVINGIFSGAPIPDIAESFRRVMRMSKASSIRNARTSMTSAQNSGRLESYKAAEKKGIEMMKVWIATFDYRTRESHIEMNGELAPINESFSNGLMYPGDPNGEPEEVYNCRCSMKVALKGIDYD